MKTTNLVTKKNNEMKEAKKKIQFVCQSKGGAGKSVFTYLAANKYPEAMIFDMDDATKTTMKQLAYRSPTSISFFNETESIDRGKFTAFIETVANKDFQGDYICDLGGATSQQLPTYLKFIGAGNLKEVLDSFDIELEIICIMAGGSIFSSCYNFLIELSENVNNQFKIIVALNEFMPLTKDQTDYFNQYKEIAKPTVIPFFISKDNTPTVQQRIEKVLESGKPLSEAPIFSKMYFNEGLKSFKF